MEYPFWDIGLGYGILMGVIAVVHVFISHFAIGGGLYLVVMETIARRRQDHHLLAFLERLSRFFVLLTLVAGALTGVGIWFIIGLLNPAGIEVLIRQFVWAWAIEWTFFFVEIAAAILYFYGWGRLSARAHLTLGWIYFVAAWMSLVVINGIITFMLTPGSWLETGDFWDGFFNPGYWPSLALRTGVCIMLAGLYALMVATRLERDGSRDRVVRSSSVWGLVGLLITIPSFYWYYSSVPEAVLAASATMFWPGAALAQSFKYAAVLGLLLLLVLALPRVHNPLVAAALMLSGLAWFGSYEWFRESLRKPYVISGYMYANGVELRKAEDYQRDGYLAHMRFRTNDPGSDLFNRACRTCHTVNGYRGIGPFFAGTDTGFIAGAIGGVHRMRGNMPPFLGNEEERALLAEYIHTTIDQRHLGEIHDLEGAPLGQRVYETRCGGCHQLGGYQDMWESIEGLDADEYSELLDDSGDFDDDMPAFSGDGRERKALIEYFMQLNESVGGNDGTS